MPKNSQVNQPKTFCTRIVYNSKFVTANKSSVKEKNRKNTQYIGNDNSEHIVNSVQVNHVLGTPQQTGNIGKQVVYTVPVTNRFDTFNIDNNLQGDVSGEMSIDGKQFDNKKVQKLRVNKVGSTLDKNSTCRNKKVPEGELCLHSLRSGEMSIDVKQFENKKVQKLRVNKVGSTSDKNSTCRNEKVPEGELCLHSLRTDKNKCVTNTRKKQCIESIDNSSSNQCLVTNRETVDATVEGLKSKTIQTHDANTVNGLTESYSCCGLSCHVVDKKKQQNS